MIIVDSSVWIDFFRGLSTPQTDKLDELLDSEELGIGDLVLTELLQGCKLDKELNEVRRSLSRLEFVVLGGDDVAVEAARNYRKLRSLGVTVRGTVTSCWRRGASSVATNCCAATGTSMLLSSIWHFGALVMLSRV